MQVERTSVDGIWWRQIPGGGEVHYLPDDPADGRWQSGPVVDALYFADAPETAWAEWYRWLAEVGVPPNAALPRDLWRWGIKVDDVADLSAEEQLRDVGLSLPVPGPLHWPQFQAIGHRLFEEGWTGLIAPSAARASGLVLCLFREDRLVRGTDPIPPPERFDQPPRVPTGMTT